MQFLKIKDDTTLDDLSEIVGYQNIEAVLALNGLRRTPEIGKLLKRRNDEAKNIEVADTPEKVKQKKITIMNRCSDDAEVFETVARLDESGWNLFASMGTFDGSLRIPEHITLPKNDAVIGNGRSVNKYEYDAIMYSIESGESPTDNFEGFQAYVADKLSNINQYSGLPKFNWFKLPIGDVTLYSSLAEESIDFPCYPSEFSDGVTANYDTMPDMLYQYEPWQIYKSSGPRKCTFTFDIHRDMWSGNHEDGECNRLIRFCEANCYPEYNGAAVNTATVTMYINGKALVSGIMTDVTPNWDADSPIGHDGLYLHLKLSLSIIEVSQTKLSYSVMRGKDLIG